MGEIVPTRLHFSTDALPMRDRFAAFNEEIVRRYTALDFVMRTAPERFAASVELWRTGRMDIGRISTTPVDSVRSPRLLRDGDDSLLVMLFTTGTAHHMQRGAGKEIGPGDAVVCDCAYSGHVNITTDAQFWSLRVPRARLAPLLPSTYQFAGAKLDKDMTARQLLFAYLRAMPDVDFSDSGRAIELYDDHLVELIAAALGTKNEVSDAGERRQACTTRRASILHVIDQQSSDHELCAAGIAAQLGITPRYLHLLLEETGRSFSQHVLQKRLEKAAAFLRDAGSHNRKVAEVAFDAGFNDLSYFNRTFRRRFGTTPMEMRRAARSTAPIRR